MGRQQCSQMEPLHEGICQQDEKAPSIAHRSNHVNVIIHDDYCKAITKEDLSEILRQIEKVFSQVYQ